MLCVSEHSFYSSPFFTLRQNVLYTYIIVPQGTRNINVASMPGLPCLSDESSQKLLKTTLAWYTFCTAYPTHANLSNGTTAHTHPYTHFHTTDNLEKPIQSWVTHLLTMQTTFVLFPPPKLLHF